MAKRKKLTKAESVRLTLRSTVMTFSMYDLEGCPKDVAEVLLSAAKRHESSFDSLRYEVADYGYDSPSLELVGEKKESDAVYSTRIKKLQAKKIKRIEAEEKREKKLLKELLEKYGD